ncbi:hypothetical protein PV328_007928 [Microctonus aethiopoides]|uniref:Uncharacterized protein n=1 Tax=Microctonus aethiopoides TaxID=144406 RepID=A0AA39C9Q8_9HYME|nr:hypothetical protein PV328_007928 [Microctonus aethiopoides]
MVFQDKMDLTLTVRVARGIGTITLPKSYETNRQIGEHGIYRRPKYQGHSVVMPGLPGHHKKTYQGRLYDGYPEVLVVVSWDVAKDWTKLIIDKSDLYTTIVSYVITLFNGVDMLYSKLKKTKIQINLAGIIIGTNEESFAFLDECRHMWINGPIVMKKMDAACANKKIISFLKARQKKISLDSYDAVVFLTSLMHDDPPFFTSDAECCGHLLKTFAEYCNGCLSWSETSETTFNLFYREFRRDFCYTNLYCKGTNNQFYRAAMPMDGTPHGIDNKVNNWLGPDSSYKDSNPNSPNVEAERSLANENLPIWILKGVIDSNNLLDTYDSDLVRNNEDGMIGYDILIRRLPMDVINFESETNRQIGEHGIYRRPKYQRHPVVTPGLPDKHAASMNYQFYEKTDQGRLYDGYPEVLVIVSWDLANYLTKSMLVDK